MLCLLLGLAARCPLARTPPANYTSAAAIEVTRVLEARSERAEAQEVSASQLSALEGQVLKRQRLQALRGLVERLAYHPPDHLGTSGRDAQLRSRFQRNLSLMNERRRNLLLFMAQRMATQSTPVPIILPEAD